MTKHKNGGESKAEAVPGLKFSEEVQVGKDQTVLTVTDDDGSNPRTVTVGNDVILSWASSVFSGNRRGAPKPLTT